MLKPTLKFASPRPHKSTMLEVGLGSGLFIVAGQLTRTRSEVNLVSIQESDEKG